MVTVDAGVDDSHVHDFRTRIPSLLISSWTHTTRNSPQPLVKLPPKGSIYPGKAVSTVCPKMK